MALNEAPDSVGGGVAGLLLVVADGGRDVPAPGTVVAGVSLIRRIVVAAGRSGLRPILGPDLETPSLVGAGTGAVTIDHANRAPSAGRQRIIVCPANVIPQGRWLRALAQAPVDLELLYVDAAMVALIETEDPGKVLAEAARCATAAELIAALSARFRRASAPFDPNGRFVLRAAGDLERAETWLLRSLIKDSEGFMSRHFERRLSLALTRRLVRTGMTPNAMTLVSLAVGLGSAGFFLSARPGWQVAGALLFLAHSILDGCDGELARLKFLESRSGAMLDFWGDNAVHAAVFGCMAIGWSLASQSALPVLLGLAAVGAVGVASAVLSGTGLQPKPPGAEATAASVVDALANRDFIYVVLALSTAGRAWWFVAIVAIGTPIFVLAALWANRDRRVQRSLPMD